MNQIEQWNSWLLESKGIDLSNEYEEYKTLIGKPKKTLEELLRYLAMIHIVNYEELSLIKPGKSRGSNNLVRARGHLVKYVTENGVLGFNLSNVYVKIFGVSKDHSTASHHKGQEFAGEELAKYKSLCNYIQNHEIDWSRPE